MGKPNLFKNLKAFNERGGFTNIPELSSAGRVWYVDAQNGSNSNGGRAYDDPLLTMARAFTLVDHYDTIVVSGVVREQLVSPAGVFDVSIIGGANRPRQATSSGTPTGGGATWMPPASGAAAATALLKLIEQGWRVENIQFVPHTSSSCITIQREDSSPEKDGSHATIVGCRFVGGTTANGILFLDGGYNCLIEDNEFESLTGTAILSSGTSVSVPANNKVLGNRFIGCTNSIAISSNSGFVIGNVFRQAADDANNKVNLISVSAQGSNNMVLENYFSDAAANVTIDKGYKPGSGDVWRNYGTGAADAIITVPS